MERKLVRQRAIEFSLTVLDIAKRLEDSKQFVMANQLVRSGTAIGALVAEAQQAETRLDFIQKMKLAAKEADETDYWFSVVRKLVEINPETIENLQIIRKILFKIIVTAKRNEKASKGSSRRSM